jgi:hypothetical protein
MKAIIYCSFIYFISIYATCNKRVDCKQTIYSFEASYKAYPDKDSLEVNDTIYFELTTPTKMNDLIRNQLIDYSGAVNFGPSIQYIALTTGDSLQTGATPAAKDFDNILLQGVSVQSDAPDLVKGFRCLEENGNYNFLIGIIPKRKGLFAIGMSNATGVYRKNNECDKASFNLTFKNTDQHLYLYEQSRPGYIPSEYESEHLYFVKVY